MEAQSLADAVALLEACHRPSEAYWRMNRSSTPSDRTGPICSIRRSSFGRGTGLFDRAPPWPARSISRLGPQPQCGRASTRAPRCRPVGARGRHPSAGPRDRDVRDECTSRAASWSMPPNWSRCSRVAASRSLPAGRRRSPQSRWRATNDHLTVRSLGLMRARVSGCSSITTCARSRSGKGASAPPVSPP